MTTQLHSLKAIIKPDYATDGNVRRRRRPRITALGIIATAGALVSISPSAEIAFFFSFSFSVGEFAAKEPLFFHLIARRRQRT